MGLIITTGLAFLTWRRRETGDGSTTQHCSTSTVSAFILKVSASLVLNVLMLNEPVKGSKSQVQSVKAFTRPVVLSQILGPGQLRTK